MSPAAARAATRATGRAAATAPAPARPRPRTRTASPAAPTPAHRSAERAAGATAERTRPAVRPQGRPASRPAAQSGRRLSFGVIWIGVTGVLLAGVVAVNVLVLRQNVALDHATRERTQLRAENAGLASQVSAAVSASRIEGLAQRSLGLQPAAPEATTYLDLARAK